MKTKGLIVIFFALSFLTCPLYTRAELNETDGLGHVPEHIEKFDTTIKVNTDGSIDVAEVIQYDFGEEQKHGIYRQIPLSEVSGGRGKTRITELSVTDENGHPYTINSIEYYSSNVYAKVGDANRTITGLHTYVVRYHAYRALGYFDAYDEIYWNATGNEWEVPIYTASATVVLPAVIAKNNLQYHSYCGAEGGVDECGGVTVEESDKSTTVRFSSDVFAGSDTMFGPYEGMTVAVGFPKGLVAVPEISIWEKDSTYYYIAGGILGFFMIVFFLWFLGSYLPKYKKQKRPIIAEYEPPQGITPSMAGVIYKKLGMSVGKMATVDIIHLAALGHISIESSDEKGGVLSIKGFKRFLPLIGIILFVGLLISWWVVLGGIIFVLLHYRKLNLLIQSFLHPMRFNLSRTGKGIAEPRHLASLYELVTKEGEAVDLDELKNEKLYYKFDEYKSQVWDALEKIESKEESPKSSIRKYMLGGALPFVLGILGLFAFFILTPIIFNTITDRGIEIPVVAVLDVVVFFVSMVIVAIIIGSLKVKLARMTPLWYAVAGLREYILVAEKERIKFESDPADSARVFSKLLPYATVFGLEQKWASVFSGIVTTPPEWYHNSTGTAFSAGAFVSSISTFRNGVGGASGAGRPSSSGGGGSSGGGSSGGGGGGGGGGSW